MFFQVLLKNKTKVTDRLYTYRYHENIKSGCRVIVPFGKGNKKRMGIVVGSLEKPEFDKIKSIEKVLDEEPILNEELISIAFFMVDEYLSDLSSAMQTVLPPGNFSEIVEYFYYEGESEEELLVFLKERRSWEEIQKKFSVSHLDLMERSKRGEIEFFLERKNNVSEKKIRMVRLTKDYKNISLSSRATAQIKILHYLKEHGEVLYENLLGDTGTSSSAVTALRKKNILEIEERKVFRKVAKDKPEHYEKIQFNEEQSRAFERIIEAGKEGKNHFLLQGVTGSGKTELYLQLVEKAVEEGKGTIVLVPEISLTPQTIARFSGRFPGMVAVLHSRLSLNERFDQWKQIQTGHFKIVIGARSAIFAPVKDLGLIVVDEEHELSYISEKNPKYDALEIAEFRSNYHNCPLILGSATPSIEHFFKTKEEKYEFLELSKRANNTALPEVNVVDMREEMKNGNFSMFSSVLREGIAENLKKNEQSILFLNKRGHSSYIFCRRCGYVMECDHCDVAMTYHKRQGRLICHLCGRTKIKEDICPNCGSKAIKEFGAGTEKLEEETRAAFPQARILRIDSDTMANKDSYDQLYKKMKNREVDILLGTQMIAKGMDFSAVTLVGVIAADISLNQGNYRASERTFQLLTQVAGRAGRGDLTGKVYIQSYKPEHYAIQAGKHQNFQDFYNEEIRKRKQFKYPPFYNLANIKIFHPNRYRCREKIFEVLKILQGELLGLGIEFHLSGPNPCPVEWINNFYRFEINYKFPKGNEKYKEVFKRVLNDNIFKIDWKGYRMTMTMNPVNFY
ncbi:MAG: primosomal protein N' [Gallicola sp.]|nr:primosomal protein N' [Gallicola sp.]